MTTKEKILDLLDINRGTFFSGEDLAEQLSVSRTAVWKAVNALKEQGYEIQSVQNKGYCLSEFSDVMSENGIRQYLNEENRKITLTVFEKVDSTNAMMRSMANEGAAEGNVIIAQYQTEGRGRLGRKFYSPIDSGIYMSILLRPEDLLPNQAMRITTMAAVAAGQAIESVTGKNTQIKWVNDIFMHGKKVSGILTEAAFNMESGRFDYIVLGIGMNVYEPKGGFPEDLKEIAGAVLDKPTHDGKNRIAAEFINRFMYIYRAKDPSLYAEEYRSRSMVIGKPINVIFPTEQKEAIALDVDNECRLIVRYHDGSIENLSSAEVSIREI